MSASMLSRSSAVVWKFLFRSLHEQHARYIPSLLKYARRKQPRNITELFDAPIQASHVPRQDPHHKQQLTAGSLSAAIKIYLSVSLGGWQQRTVLCMLC